MTEVTQLRESPAMREATRLRTRGECMLELATRAYCEQHYDFARLLTQLATEAFSHARELEESYAFCATTRPGELQGRRRHRS